MSQYTQQEMDLAQQLPYDIDTVSSTLRLLKALELTDEGAASLMKACASQDAKFGSRCTRNLDACVDVLKQKHQEKHVEKEHVKGLLRDAFSKQKRVRQVPLNRAQRRAAKRRAGKEA